MNRTNINMLVRGARVPTLESALKIAWVLGVPVEHIWSIPGPKRRRKS
jgi:DNA-binding XRE family transcriptional regulator